MPWQPGLCPGPHLESLITALPKPLDLGEKVEEKIEQQKEEKEKRKRENRRMRRQKNKETERGIVDFWILAAMSYTILRKIT